MADVLYDAKFVLYMVGNYHGVILRLCCDFRTSNNNGHRGIKEHYSEFQISGLNSSGHSYENWPL